MTALKPIPAADVAIHSVKTLYPEPFAALVAGRSKRKLGEQFGLTNFGVNLTHLAPGAMSALSHHHSRQDEFIYILSGTAILRLGDNEQVMTAGDCIGFKAGSPLGHQLLNRSAEEVVYLEVGDRTPGDAVTYPEDDLAFNARADGSWAISHKDGTPYSD